MLRDVPALAWAYPQLQMPQGVLLPHGLIHRSQSLLLEFTLEFQPDQYSSTEAAAMPWPSASPGTWPLLLSECSQAQQSQMTAVQQHSKQQKQKAATNEHETLTYTLIGVFKTLESLQTTNFIFKIASNPAQCCFFNLNHSHCIRIRQLPGNTARKGSSVLKRGRLGWQRVPHSWKAAAPLLRNNSLPEPGWRPNHFPGQPVPMLDNPSSEVKFPNIQPKPPLVQLEAISSCPITCCLGEETDPHLSTTSFQAKQPQFPQPLLIRLLLQTLHQLCCPSLDTLQHLNVSLVVGGPKLNTVCEVRPHQCRVQGHDHFPTPAGRTISDTSQDAIGFLGHLGTLLAHIQAAVNQHPQVLFRLAAFQPLFPKPVALHGVAVAQVQDLALGLVEPHTIGLGPLIQPVQVPLQSLPTLKQINTPTQLGVVCKLTEGALHPFIQIIDKDIKQNWPQHRALGNTTCHRPPTGVNSIHHHSLGPAIQPVL
ncbi:hypothetical protein QYF61_026596 [Mycteria americana]|uniref:Uncharacterized protein n=1 Tax=Mycteria americana TaxID=33587 RepID=A0AAN7S181_MYCAM|nr:hypothetical protein QYF61_026596 [Mycteria americana]